MMTIFFCLLAVLAVLVSAFWLPLFWVVLLPVALSLPRSIRIPLLFTTGVTLDLMGGHPFGTALLALFLAEVIASFCEGVLHPGAALRGLFAFLSSCFALLLLALANIFLQSPYSLTVGREAFAGWLHVMFPSLLLGLLLGAFLASRLRPQREERLLLSRL